MIFRRSLLRTILVVVFLLLITMLGFQPTAAQSPIISPQNASRLAVKRSLEPQKELYRLSWLPDGKTLLAYGSSGDLSGVWLYGMADPQSHPRFLEGEGIFSPDGKLWASHKGGRNAD